MSESSAPGLSRAAVALVLISLAVGGFAIGVGEFASMSVLPDFAHAFGIDEPHAAHAISAYALGVVVGAPLLAVLGSRTPRWLLLAALMGMFAVGNMLSAASPTFAWMVIFRFLAGLPHGAYFGVAALVAASVVSPAVRTRAVASILAGLTVATVIGVPVATVIGHEFGWRWTFVCVAVLALLTATLVLLFAPREAAAAGASPLRELGALKNAQVWLTLGIGAIGFGGMFAVYAYLASTLTFVTGVGITVMPYVFAAFGVGMFAGNMIGAWAADHFGMKAGAVLLIWSAAMLALYPAAAHSLPTIILIVALIGGGGGLASVLQTRLMDVAGEAQTLAAALNHSAFNVANALGPFLGGLTIAAGFGWTSTAWVGVGLALVGLAIWAVAMRVPTATPTH
ncbi:MFS transporter [Phenylobacterium immobile]|uniref:MFS transporter n=1 Tax=Phenylobacterium immobile TaxID=21 RepID=UPI000AC96EC5|nr:MFS transporter [Phenylobacterium immobile]